LPDEHRSSKDAEDAGEQDPAAPPARTVMVAPHTSNWVTASVSATRRGEPTAWRAVGQVIAAFHSGPAVRPAEGNRHERRVEDQPADQKGADHHNRSHRGSSG